MQGGGSCATGGCFAGTGSLAAGGCRAGSGCHAGGVGAVPWGGVGAVPWTGCPGQDDAAHSGGGPVGGCCVPRCSGHPGPPHSAPGHVQHPRAQLGCASLHPAPGHVPAWGTPGCPAAGSPARAAPLLNPAPLSGQTMSLRRRRPSRTASSPCAPPASAPSSASAPRTSWEGEEGSGEGAGRPAFPWRCPELRSWLHGTSPASLGWCLAQGGCRGERGAAPRSGLGVPSSLGS